MSLETLARAGGVEKWAAAARTKAVEDSEPTVEQRSRAQMLMDTAWAKIPQLALGGPGTTVPKGFYPMLVPRTNTMTRKATCSTWCLFLARFD